jgi:hypothetical protein
LTGGTSRAPCGLLPEACAAASLVLAEAANVVAVPATTIPFKTSLRSMMIVLLFFQSAFVRKQCA